MVLLIYFGGKKDIWCLVSLPLIFSHSERLQLYMLDVLRMKKVYIFLSVAGSDADSKIVGQQPAANLATPFTREGMGQMTLWYVLAISTEEKPIFRPLRIRWIVDGYGILLWHCVEHARKLGQALFTGPKDHQDPRRWPKSARSFILHVIMPFPGLLKAPPFPMLSQTHSVKVLGLIPRSIARALNLLHRRHQ